MTIFARYTFRQAAGALALILGSLSGIVWIALALRQLNVVTSQGQDAWLLLKMTTLALPNLVAIIAPFAMLIAMIHTLNRLNGDSELIVLTASGATVWTVARPLLLLAAIVSAGVAFVNHAAMPWSLRTLRTYIIQVRTDLLTQVIQPGRFSNPEPNLTFHIRERALNGELLGLVMHDTRNPKEIQSYLAERGIIVKQESTAYLIMLDGHIVRRTSPKEPSQIIAFEKYIVDLNRFEQKSEESDDLKPRERYHDELANPEPDSFNYKIAPGQFRAELHERFSNPIYPFTFVLIALAAVGQAQSTRQNRVERIVIAFLAAVGIRLGGLAVNNLVVLNAAMTPLLYAIPIVSGAGAFALMIRAARPRGGASWIERIWDLIGPPVARIAGRFPGAGVLARSGG